MNERAVLALGLTSATLMLMIVLYALHGSITHMQRERLELSSCGREDSDDKHDDDGKSEKTEHDRVEHGRPRIEFTRK